MVRTIEDVLGLVHLNLNTATARPMTNVFDLSQTDWTFDAVPSAVLLRTKLPLSATSRAAVTSIGSSTALAHDAAYWANATAGLDFSGEDRVDSAKFNRILWRGLKAGAYPVERTGTRFSNTPHDDDDR